MLVGILIILAFLAGFFLDYFISEARIKKLEERIEALEHIIDDFIEIKNRYK